MACKPELDVPLLHGKWQAYSIEKNGKVDTASYLKEVQFEFNNTGRYLYQSTLNKQQAGKFRVNEKLLYTQDTISQSKEKAVEIIRLDKDTLSIKMNHAGVIELLSFKKI